MTASCSPPLHPAQDPRCSNPPGAGSLGAPSWAAGRPPPTPPGTYHFGQSRDDFPQCGQGLVDVCSFLVERPKAQILRPCFRAALKPSALRGWRSPSTGRATSNWSYWATSTSQLGLADPAGTGTGQLSDKTPLRSGSFQCSVQGIRQGKDKWHPGTRAMLSPSASCPSHQWSQLARCQPGPPG